MAESRNSELVNLTEISEVYQLTQILNKRTRITVASKSLIDLIFTNQESKVVTHGMIDCGISDHCLVYVVRKIAVPTNNRQNILPQGLLRISIQVSLFKNCVHYPGEILSFWTRQIKCGMFGNIFSPVLLISTPY